MSFHIGSRDGYGMNEHLVTQAAEAGINTILTCDNGSLPLIRSIWAKELGMTVVVTDHHEVPYIEEKWRTPGKKISEADAIVNPKQEACQYPFEKSFVAQRWHGSWYRYYMNRQGFRCQKQIDSLKMPVLRQ